ncbi:uncharacterized protein TNCV_3485031 [Trichonephila clavipes]|nr:uncharacterized protein TNCV_3485031 [Trichonephila clavipes]
MVASSSFVIPTPLAHADNQEQGHPRGGRAPLHWCPTKFNLYDPGVRSANGFSVLPEVYFSRSENVQEFLEGIDNQILLLEKPSDLSCAYLKGHLLGRAQDWYQIFGTVLVQNTATEFAHLKAALSKAFPAIRNKKELEINFYASQQRRDQEPTDFANDLLKLNKKLELGKSEEALVDHIFIRVEVRKIHKTWSNCWRSYLSLRKDIRAKQCGIRGIVIMLKDGMSVRCLMMIIVEEIGEIWKLCVDRVMVGMIIGLTTRMAVKEISGSTARTDFRRMIEDLTIGDTNLEMGVKRRILVEETTEIEVRVRILVEAIGGKGDD